MTTAESQNPARYEDLQKDPYNKEEELQKLTREITELTDINHNNDSIESNVIVNNVLNNSLQEYLKKNGNVTNLIEGELNRIIKDSNTSETARTSAESLLKLIQSIHNVGEESTAPEVKEQSQEPKLGLTGNIGIIESATEGGKGRFYSELVKDRPANLADNEKGGPLDLWRTKENLLSGQQTRINELLKGKPELDKNKDFSDVKKLLEDIQKVIENPVEPNVINLQTFIFANLEGKAKEDFHTASFSKKNNKFDGKFGVGTLTGLNKVLEKTEKYISEVEKLNKAETQEATSTAANGAEQQAAPAAEQQATSTTEQQAAPAVEQQATSAVEQQAAPAANFLDNGGKEHYVMKDSNELANICGLNNAIFYSSLEKTDQIKEIDGDREYLMKMGEKVYKVKLDSDGKLCPLAENNNSGVKVLFKNIASCKQYLQNKIPSGVNANIGWSERKQDYVIASNGRTLTIEPMTMDGKWVSNKLSDCLVLMNLTNFLRGAGEIDDVNFKNDNPDLKFDDGKLYIRVNKKEKWGEKGKGGKWYPVPMDKFGLNEIKDKEVLNKFVKYNNGEHWEDNWDKKGDNKGYKKIDLTVGYINTGTSTETRASTGTSTETGTSTGVVASEVGTSAGTTSAEAGTSTGVLKDVIVTGSVLRPKNPINFGPENEQINENKTGKLEGIGSFDGNGSFIFDKDIQENIEGDKNTIKIGDDEFTKINYEKEKGISIQGFSGKGYQVGNTGEIKRFFVGEYNDETKKGTGKRIFENGACYEGEWSEGLEDGKGKYTYSNGDIYEGDFKEGNLDGNGTYTWKNGCSFKGEFKDNEMTKGLVVLKSKGGEIISFDVENDGKGLKIISDNVDGTKGKYLDIKKGDVVDSLGNQPSDVVSKGTDGGLDNNKDGAESESNFVDEGNKRIWKNGNKFEGEIKDGKIIKGIFFISDGGSNGVCQVERDEKGLKIISEGPNANKYIDENTGEIKDINEAPVPVSSKSRIDFANAAMAKDLGIDFNMPNKFEYDGISIDVVDEYSIKSGKGDEIIYFSDPETEDIQKDIATLIAISKCLKGAKKVEIKDENTLTVTKQGGQQEFNIKNMGLVDNGGTLLNKIEDVCRWMNNYIKKHPDTINESGNVTTQNSVGETDPNTRDDQVYESTSYSWKQPKRDSDA